MSTETPAVPVVKVKTAPLPYKLIVKFAFADYQVGQEITAADEVAAVLDGDCAGKVLKVASA